MFHLPIFWYVLTAAVVVHWTLPPRWRVGFVATVSIGIVAVLAPVVGAIVLFWTLLAYFLAPLAVTRRPQAITRQSVQLETASEAVRARGGVRVAGPPSPAAIADDPPTAHERRGRRWIALLFIAAIVVFTMSLKVILPLLRSGNGSVGIGPAGVVPAGIIPGDTSPAPLPAWLLPLGISCLSCFTFKIIHYTIEVARGNVKDRSLVNLLCYAFLFPTFVMGPIERFDHFLRERESRCTREGIGEGLMRILIGLIKWCVLGEILFGPAYRWAVSGEMLQHLGRMTTLELWWAAIQLYLYGYMNFAGYSDVAIGASRLFGLRIMENFDSPLLATNPANFWKRWHMTLAGWCQTYVFMPVMGYTRRPNLATYASFIVIGLWHGVSLPWLIWGLYHATGVVLFGTWVRYRRRRKWKWAEHQIWSAVGICCTILFIAAGEMLTFGGAHSIADLRLLFGRLLFLPMT